MNRNTNEVVSSVQPMHNNYQFQNTPHMRPVSTPAVNFQNPPPAQNDEDDELRRIREMILDTQNEIQKMQLHSYPI